MSQEWDDVAFALDLRENRDMLLRALVLERFGKGPYRPSETTPPAVIAERRRVLLGIEKAGKAA